LNDAKVEPTFNTFRSVRVAVLPSSAARRRPLFCRLADRVAREKNVN